MVQVNSLLPQQYDSLADYLASFPEETRQMDFWLERFRLWWEVNPAFSQEMERGWILMDQAKVVGFLGIFPSYFQLQGRETIVFNSTTWRVSEGYRNHSLSLLFKQIQYAKDSLLFSTTPNEVVSRVNESLRYRSIQREDETVYFFYVNPRKVLKEFSRGRCFVEWIGRGFVPFLQVVQNLYLQNGKNTEDLRIEELRNANSEFDGLWENTKGRYLNTTVRNQKMINWYCFGSRYFEKPILGAFKNDNLLAYMILRQSQRGDLRMLECLDFWGQTENKEIIGAFIRELLKYAQKKAVDLIKFPSFSAESNRTLCRLGLFRIRPKQRLKYVKGSAEMMRCLVKEKTYFSEFIGDNGL
jgi:hypothetical protein